MSIFRNTRTLLSLTTAAAQPQDGTAYAILPKQGDGVSEADQRFRVFFDGVMTGGAGTPTVDARLVTSHDKTNWIVVASMTQLTGANPSRHEFVEVSALGPYVKAVTLLGGTTLPNHTATIVLASNGSFELKAVS